MDIELFDISKCFDKLWLKECLNDLYEAGLSSSNLNLLYEGNKECFLSIKLPGSKTKRIKLKDLVMQGSVWGPLSCTSSMDKIGQRSYKTGSPLYTYKGLVSIPPLGMIDDEITMAECGSNSALTNVYMNNFTESKRLTFGIKKCKKMHIGKETLLCDDIKVHDKKGEKVTDEKYIGDVISSDGTNTKNLKERIDKGYGIVNEIVSILDEVPLGKYKIIAGIKLREAMLLNGILFNSEIWYGLTEEDIEKLSFVDEYLLRSILKAPSKTPKETLYLETGCKPIKFIIKKRRLMYLHHILRRPKDEVIRKFYVAQKLKPSRNDWVLTVENDKNELEIKLCDEEIEQLTKYKFKKYLEEKLRK